MKRSQKIRNDSRRRVGVPKPRLSALNPTASKGIISLSHYYPHKNSPIQNLTNDKKLLTTERKSFVVVRHCEVMQQQGYILYFLDTQQTIMVARGDSFMSERASNVFYHIFQISKRQEQRCDQIDTGVSDGVFTNRSVSDSQFKSQINPKFNTLP